jgi:N-acetyl-anhydromuramyl-L-alanine amidase AmpD
LKIDANGWLDVALEGNYSSKSMSRYGYKPSHICLHGTAGGTSALAIANYFASSDVQASSHFVIGQDGTIIQGVSCLMAAWGNGILVNPRLAWDPNINPNYYTISIEHVKSSDDNSDALTPAQQQASFQLIECLCNSYNIPKRAGDLSGGIVSHADFDSVNRARCPGPYPWTALYTYLNQPTQPSEEPMHLTQINEVGNYFLEVPNRGWQRKDHPEIILGGAHLTFFRYNRAVERFGLPRSNEIPLHIAGHPEITAVVFEKGVNIYDPTHKLDQPFTMEDQPEKRVYAANLTKDPGLTLIAQAAIKPLQDKINALQAQLQQQGQEPAAVQDAATQMQQVVNGLMQVQTALDALKGMAQKSLSDLAH